MSGFLSSVHNQLWINQIIFCSYKMATFNGQYEFKRLFTIWCVPLLLFYHIQNDKFEFNRSKTVVRGYFKSCMNIFTKFVHYTITVSRNILASDNQRYEKKMIQISNQWMLTDDVDLSDEKMVRILLFFHWNKRFRIFVK